MLLEPASINIEYLVCREYNISYLQLSGVVGVYAYFWWRWRNRRHINMKIVFLTPRLDRCRDLIFKDTTVVNVSLNKKYTQKCFSGTKGLNVWKPIWSWKLKMMWIITPRETGPISKKYACWRWFICRVKYPYRRVDDANFKERYLQIQQ